MPAIPLITNRVSSLIGAPDTRATPEDFGAMQGRALQQLGQSVGGLAEAGAAWAQQDVDRARREREANNMAEGSVALSRIALRAREQAPADGSGTAAATQAEQREYIDRYTATIKDPIERMNTRRQLTERSGGYGVSATEFEFQQNAQNSKIKADGSLNGLANLVRADSTQYENAAKDGAAVIEAMAGVNATQKAAMVQEWRERLANTRFEGVLGAAKQVEDFDVIEKELTAEGSPWKERMKPENFDKALDRVRTARKEFATLADTQARSAIEKAETRLKETMKPLLPDDLNEIKSLTMQSRNPITHTRAARLLRDNDILSTEAGLSEGELRARANATATRGLPTEVSSPINEAARAFPSVSAGYLGATAQREYGQFLRGQGRANVDARFAPVAAEPGVDLRNVEPDVQDALAVVGAKVGRALVVTSGRRTITENANARGAVDSKHLHGTGVDIRVRDMTEPERVQVVAELKAMGLHVIYGTKGHFDHIHAERDPDGPRIAIPGAQPIDYGRGTQITDAEGRPTSSAVGLFQFTRGTWLDLMKDGATAQRIGLNVAGKSDDELLAMRTNPRVSTLMAAALAEKNKKALEAGLGRAVSDAELYMAHVLGAPTATSFISDYRNNPDRPAYALAPAAAEANRALFYTKDGTARTVKQVYDNFATRFSTSPTTVQYGDAKTRNDAADRVAARVKDDPMTHARDVGRSNATDINQPGGFAARAVEANNVASIYSVPLPDMRPFTKEEATNLIKQFKEGTSDDVLAIMSRVQEMERVVPGMGIAGMKQLGMTDTAIGYAAALAADRGNETTANNIVRGQKILDNSKSAGKNMFGIDAQANGDFNKTVGGALQGVRPEMKDAIFQSAKAHYAATFLSGGDKPYNPKAFTQSVEAVLGREGAEEAIGNVNGKPTILPKGLTAREFNNAVDRMTDGDFVQFSRTGEPPRSRDGHVVPARDIAYEAEFVFIGKNMYQLRMSDGKVLTTGRATQSGGREVYIFVADPLQLKQRAAAPRTAPEPTSGLVRPTPAQPNDPFNPGDNTIRQ